MVAHFLDSREITPFGECIVTLIHTSSFRKLFGKNSRSIFNLLFWNHIPNRTFATEFKLKLDNGF